MLAIAVLVLLASFGLEVRSDQRVAARGLPNIPLPPTCPLHEFTGCSCPGCGLTRSFVHLAHGDVQASLNVHRLGWLLALAVVAQIPFRLVTLRWPDREILSLANRRRIGLVLITLLIANWWIGVACIDGVR